MVSIYWILVVWSIGNIAKINRVVYYYLRSLKHTADEAGVSSESIIVETPPRICSKYTAPAKFLCKLTAKLKSATHGHYPVYLT